MQDILIVATAIAAVTSGVVQALKKTELINKKYMSIVAIVVGALLGAAAIFIDLDLISRIWAGGISGLAATGLFEFGKNTIKKGE